MTAEVLTDDPLTVVVAVEETGEPVLVAAVDTGIGLL